MCNLLFRTFPFLASFVNKHDFFPDFENRIHIVCIDDRRHIILVGKLTDQIIDNDRSQRVQTRVRFVTEQKFRLQDNSPGDSHPFFHTSTDLRGIQIFGFIQFHPMQAKECPFSFLLVGKIGKQVEGKHHIFQYRL